VGRRVVEEDPYAERGPRGKEIGRVEQRPGFHQQLPPTRQVVGRIGVRVGAGVDREIDEPAVVDPVIDVRESEDQQVPTVLDRTLHVAVHVDVQAPLEQRLQEPAELVVGTVRAILRKVGVAGRGVHAIHLLRRRDPVVPRRPPTLLSRIRRRHREASLGQRREDASSGTQLLSHSSSTR
jgi:hypothetical protein